MRGNFCNMNCSHPIARIHSNPANIYEKIALLAQCRLKNNNCLSIDYDHSDSFEMFFGTEIIQVSGPCLSFVTDCINKVLTKYPNSTSNLENCIRQYDSLHYEIKKGTILLAFYNTSLEQSEMASLFRHIAIYGGDGKVYQLNGPNGCAICDYNHFINYYQAPRSLVYAINDYVSQNID